MPWLTQTDAFLLSFVNGSLPSKSSYGAKFRRTRHFLFEIHLSSQSDQNCSPPFIPRDVGFRSNRLGLGNVDVEVKDISKNTPLEELCTSYRCRRGESIPIIRSDGDMETSQQSRSSSEADWTETWRSKHCIKEGLLMTFWLSIEANFRHLCGSF